MSGAVQNARSQAMGPGGLTSAIHGTGESGRVKKIDLHIHTVQTICDRPFTYSLESFKRYVTDGRLDAVAVTNHDLFDRAQFQEISAALKATVFPGIEINVDKGHLLVITSPSDTDDFAAKTALVSRKIKKQGDSISVDELRTIFGDLSKYLLIPHYDKGPALAGDALNKLKPFISAGEVDSAKKFLRVMKDASKLTPVLFSDSRMQADLERLPNRQTFIDCGTLTIAAIKACLRDKQKVALSEHDGNKLWPVLQDGQKLSTGLNVVVGARSSGKTHTLDEIEQASGKVKYIKQFSLVQQSATDDERAFTTDVERSRSMLTDQYLTGLKNVLEDVTGVDVAANHRKVAEYLETLLKSAAEIDRHDNFSRTVLFNEIDLSPENTEELVKLIASVRHLIENFEFRTIIDKHIDPSALKALACELIQLLWQRAFENKKKNYVNGITRDIKKALRVKTAAVQIEDVDLYETAMDAKRVERFNKLVGLLQKETVLSDESVGTFRIEARKHPFTGAGEIRAANGAKGSFSDAFSKYRDPYEYLRELLSNEAVTPSEIYRLFVKISYRILNKDGYEVSGGERSEFRLLQQISDAQNYDMLLIDEPESSFDNVFLHSDVNRMLKALSETMPVVVVTHNSTVGASIGADYLLHTRKEVENEEVVYRLYSGYPTDKTLHSTDGKAISCHDVVMDTLEAGVAAYEYRKQGYETLKG